MSTISRAAFAVSWTTQYPALLDSGEGRLVTRAGYTDLFNQIGSKLCLPWEEREHPSWFWSRYLVASGRIRNVSADKAFDRLVPFRWLHGRTIIGPATVEDADVL